MIEMGSCKCETCEAFADCGIEPPVQPAGRGRAGPGRSSCGIDLSETIAESWRIPRRLHNLIRLLRGELTPKLAMTPHRVVAQWGRVRLLGYEPRGERLRSPVLMIPSIINRYYVLDLRPGESLVEYLTDHGIPVYVLDWGRPGPQDRHATLDDHIVRWQGAAVRAACRDAGVGAIHLLGYCLGGTFAIAYAAARPQRVAGLIALTAPVSFRDQGTLTVWARCEAFDVRRLSDEFGLIPCELLQSSFLSLSPATQLQKLRMLVDRLWDEGFVERFLALETWLCDNVDFPGATYVRHIEELYRKNSLVKGELVLCGEPVRLERIACPVLTVLSTKDHIVPEPSASMLDRLVSSKDHTLLALEGGHIGCTVGRGARDGLYPATREWLAARPCPPIE
jgi:polyhydroxyalkanoate synthase